MRTRMTRTSRPAARARSWKPRSPSGLRWCSGLAGTGGPAGSAFVTVLTTVRLPERRESWCATLRGDLAQLSRGRRVDARRERRQVERGEQRLASGAELVAQVGLEQGDVGRAGLHRVHQVP